MGRSVSYATGSLLIAYADWFDPSDEYVAEERERLEEDEDWYPEPDQDDWDFWVEDIQDVVCELWPSFERCDEWIGREDRAVAENKLGYIGVSEYCGLASIWFAPKDSEWYDDFPREAFAEAFAKRIGKRFYESFGTLRLMGRFSNGEAVFERIEREAA